MPMNKEFREWKNKRNKEIKEAAEREIKEGKPKGTYTSEAKFPEYVDIYCIKGAKMKVKIDKYGNYTKV